MTVQGLPDFHHPLQREGIQIFYPYEGVGAHTLLPSALEIALRPDGQPEFALDIIRGEKPSLPPQPSGRLDFRVVPYYALDKGLQVLRDRHTHASLRVARFTNGFLRFIPPLSQRQEFPTPLRQPIPLAWNGLENARFHTKLPINDAVFLEQSLRDGVLTMEAIAEVEMLGIAPRVPVTVRFDPALLVTKLQEFAASQSTSSQFQESASPKTSSSLPRATVVKFFNRERSRLPLTIAGSWNEDNNEDETERFAEAMTDWVRIHLGQFVAAPTLNHGPHMALKSAQEVGSGQFIWDLSQPLQTLRPFVLRLGDPFETALRLVQNQGIDAIVFHSTVPSLSIGMHQISLIANVPPRQQGAIALGVRVRIPPKPPWRFRPITKTQELGQSQPHGDSDRSSAATPPTIPLRLTPLESLESLNYTVSTFAVIQDAAGIEQLEGPPRDHSGDQLYVTTADFPIDFLPLVASRSLLTIADVKGVLKRPDQTGQMLTEPFSLTADHPDVAIALLKDTLADATLEIQAVSKTSDRVVTLGPIPAQALRISEHSFIEYGPQTVPVTCNFQSSDQNLVVFEFLPEGGREDNDIRLLFFSPQDAQKELRWLARSPFLSRYRYRRKSIGASAPPPSEWSDYLSPFNPLILSV